jgi:hypothetical protein
MNQTATLNDMLGYGVLAAHDEEMGFYIMANGAYLNFYSRVNDDGFICHDCRHIGDKDFYTLTAAEMMDKARTYLDHLVNGEDEEEDE